MKYKVSINCITYNHEKFIRQTLEGFVMQKTNFPFIVHISDDASTDRTQEIIREYADEYPDIIKPNFRTKNDPKTHYVATMMLAEGEYYANCEGDDYWVDPFKLQKQVDFLDSHPECSICFHNTVMEWQDDSGQPVEMLPPIERHYKNGQILDINDLLKGNFIAACSVMYRWRFNRTDFKIEDQYPNGIDPGDWFMHLFHAQVGKIGFLYDVMAVYRRHKGGIWYFTKDFEDQFYLRNIIPQLKWYIAAEKRFQYDYSSEKKRLIIKGICLAKKYNRKDIQDDICSLFTNEEVFSIYYRRNKMLAEKMKISLFFAKLAYKIRFGIKRKIKKNQYVELKNFVENLKSEKI